MSTYSSYPFGDFHWKSPVDNAAALPASSNSIGDARVAKDTQVIYVWSGSAWTPSTGGGGTGTVTSVSVVSANGLAGSVANPTTTPAITLSTTVTGILQGNGTAISAATTTGSGSVVLATSPTLVTPNLGTPSAIVLTNATGLPLTTGVAGVLPIANGGTNSSAALNNNRVMKSLGGAIVEAAAITANRALASDANGIPVASTATATELGYLSGVTSPIQTQIDGINNLSTSTTLYEDWIGDAVGKLRWLDADVGTGVSATGLTVASNANPGICEFSTGASATGSANRYLGGVTTGAATAGFILGGGQITMEWLVRIEDLSTVTERYNFDVGLVGAATLGVDSVRFLYADATSANWLASCSSASSNTNTDTGVAVVADTWVKLRIIINAAGNSIAYYINGALVATNTTNIPSVTIAPRVRMLKTIGTTARVSYVDYFMLTQTFTVAR